MLHILTEKWLCVIITKARPPIFKEDISRGIVFGLVDHFIKLY